MIKVLTVFGTRPEAIKMCPVVLEMKKDVRISPIVLVTGQHREMLDQVMNTFNVEPNIDLAIMRENQTLDSITSNVLSGVANVLRDESPDIMLVHGDTTTSYASALAGFYNNTPIGHVEAGLRTYDYTSPFPEEFNRQSVDMISNVLYAPTHATMQNLLNEGKRIEDIVVTGNTVIDALKTTVKEDYMDDNLEWAKGSKLILMTAHRRENWGDTMFEMFSAVKHIVESYHDVKCIYPVHKNPKVREVARKVFDGVENVRLIEPLEVEVFHNYINNCYLVLTDSGGVQEEAPALGKPVLVMRNTTERSEGIQAGTIKLVGVKKNGIIQSVEELMENKNAYRKMCESINPYGDGKASGRIVDDLVRRFG